MELGTTSLPRNPSESSPNCDQKKGKFSAAEDDQLRQVIDKYRIINKLQEDQIQSLIFAKHRKRKGNLFWTEIAAALPERSFNSVYKRVQRKYHSKPRGQWTQHEDAFLISAVSDLGQAWAQVSLLVGRPGPDCRDRYRDYLAHAGHRNSGKWSPEEEARLTQIITEMISQQGDNAISWDLVSQQMGRTRGRQKCQEKWLSLNKIMRNEGQAPHWSPQDARKLVNLVDRLGVQNDDEIIWSKLEGCDLGLWTGRDLQRRWKALKSGIKKNDTKTHQEIVKILQAKYTNTLLSDASSQAQSSARVGIRVEAGHSSID